MQGVVMAIQFKEFTRPAFSGDADELKKKVVKYCNKELRCFRIISISEANRISDDFYRITVWYDDEAEKYEHLMSASRAEDTNAS
jgi:predicted aldo/keto reductase-like oxidoreductase